MSGRVTEVTERSGRDTEVTERVQRLRRFMEICTEGVEMCGGYGDLDSGAVMRIKELY